LEKFLNKQKAKLRERTRPSPPHSTYQALGAR
jgi:hypothetical protein